MHDIILLDTNVLIYAFDSSEKIKHKIAAEILEKSLRGDLRIALSAQNLVEFFFVVTKKIETPLDLVDAENIIVKLSKFKGIEKVFYSSETIVKSMDILKMYQLSIWDSILIATMIENGIFIIYTEDEKGFNKVNNIKVVNPFK